MEGRMNNNENGINRTERRTQYIVLKKKNAQKIEKGLYKTIRVC